MTVLKKSTILSTVEWHCVISQGSSTGPQLPLTTITLKNTMKKLAAQRLTQHASEVKGQIHVFDKNNEIIVVGSGC